MFPGARTSVCGEYDPRFRPWYVAAASKPKNVIIMIDSSKTTKDKDRAKVTKDVTAALLSTLNSDDSFNVVDFDESARTRVSRNIFDSCVSEQLISSTPQNINLMKEW